MIPDWNKYKNYHVLVSTTGTDIYEVKILRLSPNRQYVELEIDGKTVWEHISHYTMVDVL